MNNIPNIISASRAVAALVILSVPAFSPVFWILYCWCGISDMIDGMLARKMNVTTELGSRIDSVADLVFAICNSMLHGYFQPVGGHSIHPRPTYILRQMESRNTGRLIS